MTNRPVRGHKPEEPGDASSQGSQFVRYFGPMLDALRELGDSGTPDEVVERIAKNLQLPDSVLSETLASGESRYRNQVQWARFYLVKEGLVGASRRGVSTIELIDGVKLVALLENLQPGVRPVQTFEVDEAFFDGFRSDGER